MHSATTQRKNVPLDCRIGAVIFLFAAFLYYESRGYPDKAALYPAIMLVTIMLLSLYVMAASLLKRRKNPAADAPPSKSQPDLKAVFAFSAMTTLYALVSPYIGFGLASMLFISAGAMFFGERSKLAIAGVSVAATVCVYIFFIHFLDVQIPFFPVLS